VNKFSPMELINQRLYGDVKKYGKISSYKAKDPLFSPDEMLDKFFFVLEGRIKVYQINFEDAKELTLQILSSGDMYDVVTLLDGEVHDNLLEAIDDVKIITFPIEIIREWMRSDSQFNSLLLPYIAKQFRATEEKVLDLAFLDTGKRLMKLIMKNTLQKNSMQKGLLNNLTHDDLASLIGTVRKVLNRQIQKLKKDGILNVSRREIEILDREKLLQQLPVESI